MGKRKLKTIAPVDAETYFVKSHYSFVMTQLLEKEEQKRLSERFVDIILESTESF